MPSRSAPNWQIKATESKLQERLQQNIDVLLLFDHTAAPLPDLSSDTTAPLSETEFCYLIWSFIRRLAPYSHASWASFLHCSIYGN